jgi:hypothetical protein
MIVDEDGADFIKDILERSVKENISVKMHVINFIEVYYDTYRSYGEIEAYQLYKNIKNQRYN